MQADPVIPDDPTQNSQALNRYSYTFNNPLKFTDPTGNDPEDTEQARPPAVTPKAGEDATKPAPTQNGDSSGRGNAAPNSNPGVQGQGEPKGTPSGAGNPTGKKNPTPKSTPADPSGKKKDRILDKAKRAAEKAARAAAKAAKRAYRFGRILGKDLFEDQDPTKREKEVVEKWAEGDKKAQDNLNKNFGNTATDDAEGHLRNLKQYGKDQGAAASEATKEAGRQIVEHVRGKTLAGRIKGYADMVVDSWRESADPNR